MTRHHLIAAAVLIAAATLSLPGCQHDGGAAASSAASDANQKAQQAMAHFIDQRTVDDLYPYYDPIEGRLLKMKFESLHAGVKQMGDFHVSCADFVDQFNRKLDVDFFVLRGGSEFCVTQGLLHKVDGTKRKYDLTSP